MGVILQGILGGFSGKVGPVVGGKWKDIDYMRSYVIPSNPNTAGQQLVRGKFAELVLTAKSIISTILQPYWDPFESSMSGFNNFISRNWDNSLSTGKLTTSNLMAHGTLEPITDLACTYTTGTGALAMTWTGTIVGNGLDTDEIIFVAYESVSGYAYTIANNTARNAGSDSGTIPAGFTATNVIVFGFLWRGTGQNLIVSDSLADTCAAP